jgi:hypothetical protein
VLAQLGEGQRPFGRGKRRDDALVERDVGSGCWLLPIHHFEREGVSALRELDRHRLQGWRGAVLDGEDEVVGFAAQVEVAVAPGVELGGAAQGLAGADGVAALLGMVDDGDGDAVAALQLAQVQ